MEAQTESVPAARFGRRGCRRRHDLTGTSATLPGRVQATDRGHHSVANISRIRGACYQSWTESKPIPINMIADDMAAIWRIIGDERLSFCPPAPVRREAPPRPRAPLFGETGISLRKPISSRGISRVLTASTTLSISPAGIRTGQHTADWRSDGYRGQPVCVLCREGTRLGCGSDCMFLLCSQPLLFPIN